MLYVEKLICTSEIISFGYQSKMHKWEKFSLTVCRVYVTASKFVDIHSIYKSNNNTR